MDEDVKRAKARALEWLAAKQDPNTGACGDQRYPNNMAITGFCLMAFMSQGHVPNEGKYGPEVAKGLRYLLANADDKGYLAGPGGLGNMYCHGMATLALSQLFGMTGDEATGVRVVRAFVREPEEVVRFATANEELTETSLRAGRLMSSMFPTVNLLVNMSSVGVLWIGADRVAAGHIPLGETAIVEMGLRVGDRLDAHRGRDPRRVRRFGLLRACRLLQRCLVGHCAASRRFANVLICKPGPEAPELMPTKLVKAAPVRRLIGYAQVSTDDQNLDLQRDALEGAGRERLYTDVASGAFSSVGMPENRL